MSGLLSRNEMQVFIRTFYDILNQVDSFFSSKVIIISPNNRKKYP